MTKKGVILLASLVLVLLVVIVGCERKVTEVVEDSTEVCQQCHSDNTLVVAVGAQWDNSVHATGGNFDHNTPPCSGCHTSEGFIARLATGDPGTPENPSAIGCFTCHQPHTNYNFNLRIDDPVALETGGTFDLGNGNLCANCHQARTPNPPIPTSGTITITNSRWGPHHGTQGNLLSGNGAHVFGSAYDNGAHTTAAVNGCPMCHMATPVGDQAGGHTFNVTYDDGDEDNVAGCNIEACHNGGVEDFEYHEVQDSVETLLEALRAELLADSLITSSNLVNTDFTDSLGRDDAGALFNFLFFEDDRSLGIHNPDYAIEALNASIAYMQGR